MRFIKIIRLLHHIFSKKPIDLEWIQSQGLLAVKIAQTFALRIDILDPERCKDLSKLYRNNDDGSEGEDVLKLLNQHGKESFRDNFSEFDTTPFSVASVGQVHKAVTKKDDETVVVKLIKTEHEQSFRKDVKAAQFLLRVAILFYPPLRKVADPQGILDFIKESTIDELDLTIEQKHQHELMEIQQKWSEKYDLSRLKFPKIYTDLSGKKYMTSEMIEGKTIDELLNDDAFDYDDMLELFKLHGFYLFNVGTFHGDLHPGNVIVHNSDFYFVDTGAIGKIGDNIRLGLYRFMKHLSFFDFKKCAKSLNEMAEVKLDGAEYEEYEQKFLELYKDFEGKTVSEVSLTRQMMKTIKMGVKSGMEFERGMYPIIKSMMYLDGMVLRCNPDAVLMKDVRTFVEVLDKNMPSESTDE